jgi:hypothetical protein
MMRCCCHAVNAVVVARFDPSCVHPMFDVSSEASSDYCVRQLSAYNGFRNWPRLIEDVNGFVELLLLLLATGCSVFSTNGVQCFESSPSISVTAAGA